MYWQALSTRYADTAKLVGMCDVNQARAANLSMRTGRPVNVDDLVRF